MPARWRHPRAPNDAKALGNLSFPQIESDQSHNDGSPGRVSGDRRENQPLWLVVGWVAYGWTSTPTYLLSCAFLGERSDYGLPVDDPATGGVTLWLAIHSGLVTVEATKAALVSAPNGVSCYAKLPCDPEWGGVLSPANSGLSWTRADIRVGLFLEQHRPSRVIATVRPLLPRLIADTLSRAALERAFE